MILKPFENLVFSDDFMFGHIMQDEEMCRLCLECLLPFHIGHIEYPELQKVIAPYYKSKGIRLDAYVTDGSKVYDIEIQNYAQHDLGRRTRYYQSMIDMDGLIKGDRYDRLKDSIIIFLCRFDPFKKGIPCYTFIRTCREEPSAELNDGTAIKIFNSRAYEKEGNAETKAFLKFLETNKAESDFTRRIRDMVETEKKTEELKTTYFSWGLAEYDAEYRGEVRGRQEGIAIGEARGAARGREEKAYEAARNMLLDGSVPEESIAKWQGLPLETVHRLAKELGLSK